MGQGTERTGGGGRRGRKRRAGHGRSDQKIWEGLRISTIARTHAVMNNAR
ncbi:hypothetical protein [Azospirillum doebereinerae]